MTPGLLRKLRGLQHVAERRGETLAQLALRWVLHHEVVTSVTVGANSIAQLDDNLKAADKVSFSDEECAEIGALWQ